MFITTVCALFLFQQLIYLFIFFFFIWKKKEISDFRYSEIDYTCNQEMIKFERINLLTLTLVLSAHVPE